MADLKVTRPGYGGSSKAKPPRMIIKDSSGRRLSVYRSPRQTSHGGDGQDWAESGRVGRQAVMRRQAEKLPNYSMTIVLGHQDWYRDISGELNTFISFARSKKPVTITYSKNESGLYYITDFSYDVELRSPFTNAPTRVNIEMTLTKAVIVSFKTGPISKVKPKKKPKKKAKKKKPVRKHKMKKGETLSHLALRYYKNANRWKPIADKNKIKNVRKIRIGKVLIIPYL